ncbi:DUF551 domain-containing protein [Klebsiella pneumoniae]|nr:DUF551 domain-containing protein [Klebsiella pneumoniae]MCF2762967.1 DUF551 domain-containing protein [Klebsiella pneumoniae]MCP5993721.1 DUF551 domain-containing protein [Klebsiella pneumoniae]UKL26186.1 DUF551 domain-containing protein [Klebsiella pneumoniae]WFA70016.1 DUF551 domain-containing protein [Klebsiella pneumoniae]
MTKSTITRERLQELAEGQSGFNLRTATHEESQELARMALAAMDSSESVELPLDYLQGHKDGLEWAAQLAEANHPETGDWLYDDPIELSKAIRKGPDMSPVQPVADSEPVAWTWRYREQWHVTNDKCRAEFVATDGDVAVLPLYRHAQPAPVVQEVDADDNFYSWFGREWRENYQHNQYTTAAKQMLGVIAESAWKAGCRAAMLAAAPQSPGSEPATVPGKWIPVSERMPIEFEAVIAFDGDQVYGEAMHSSDDGFTIDGYDPCDRVQLQNVTHWMPLPSAPQEVKGE